MSREKYEVRWDNHYMANAEFAEVVKSDIWTLEQAETIAMEDAEQKRRPYSTMWHHQGARFFCDAKTIDDYGYVILRSVGQTDEEQALEQSMAELYDRRDSVFSAQEALDDALWNYKMSLKIHMMKFGVKLSDVVGTSAEEPIGIYPPEYVESPLEFPVGYGKNGRVYHETWFDRMIIWIINRLYGLDTKKDEPGKKTHHEE